MLTKEEIDYIIEAIQEHDADDVRDDKIAQDQQDAFVNTIYKKLKLLHANANCMSKEEQLTARLDAFDKELLSLLDECDKLDKWATKETSDLAGRIICFRASLRGTAAHF